MEGQGQVGIHSQQGHLGIKKAVTEQQEKNKKKYYLYAPFFV